MALTQVRAKLGSVWTILTYNEATGRYEGTLTPPGTSVHQPEGYYNIEVEATNDTGQVATLDGTQYKGLRLVFLISPAQGWLTTNSPTFQFYTRDEDEYDVFGLLQSRKKLGVNTVDCYASMADAFLDDKDTHLHSWRSSA